MSFSVRRQLRFVVGPALRWTIVVDGGGGTFIGVSAFATTTVGGGIVPVGAGRSCWFAIPLLLIE